MRQSAGGRQARASSWERFVVYCWPGWRDCGEPPRFFSSGLPGQDWRKQRAITATDSEQNKQAVVAGRSTHPTPGRHPDSLHRDQGVSGGVAAGGGLAAIHRALPPPLQRGAPRLRLVSTQGQSSPRTRQPSQAEGIFFFQQQNELS